jgi:hypothetical protein
MVACLAVLIGVLVVKRDTRELLRFIKEWVQLGKEAREDTAVSARRVEAKTSQLQTAVAEMSEKIPEKVKEIVTGSPSESGTKLPTIKEQ